MMTIIYLISILISAYGIGTSIRFSVNEGKDERGKAILAKAATCIYVDLSWSCLAPVVL